MTKPPPKTNPRVRSFILLISILVPLLVGLLYLLPKEDLSDTDTIIKKFPMFNAILNGTTFILLLLAFNAIKNKKVELHRKLMSTCLALSAIFLLLYVTYHYTMPTVGYPKDASGRYFYLFILATHIIISAGIIPLVLITFVRGLAEEFDKHRKIAKITLPLWLYVTLTGVIVYFMISPYYGLVDTVTP